MKTLKKNNISQESAINSPVPVNKNCELPPFFNEDYFAHVVVQTLGELESIPCKLRQDGMVATVVQEDYSDYQLQTSRTGFGICDNNAWVKINSGDTFYDGSNLFIFPTQAEADIYKSTPTVKEGQVIYITETNTYFKYDGQDAYVDPFPNKLTVPTEDGVEGPDYKVPAYLADGAPYWRSTKDFGKVKSVNGKIGEVVLKTSDLENDSDYTTNSKLNKEVQDRIAQINDVEQKIQTEKTERISEDNILDGKITIEEAERINADGLKLDKPLENATDQYVILGDGTTSPKSDFGKVDTVNNIPPDENKNVNVDLDNILSKGNTSVTKEIRVRGLRLKSLFEEGFPSFRPNLLNIQDNIYSGNIIIDGETILVNGFCINFSDTRTNNNLYVVPENLTSSTRTLILPTKKDGKIALTSDIQSIFSQATNWTNPSQRFSSLVSKHNDATYNRLLGMDANGNANEVGLPAMTNEMSKSTDAQKDAWRIAGLKTTETYNVGQPRVDLVNPIITDKTKTYIQYVSLVGLNMFLPNGSNIKVFKKSDDTLYKTIVEIQVLQSNPSIVSFGENFSTWEEGDYYFQIYNGVSAVSSIINKNISLRVAESTENLPIPILTYESSLPEIVITGNSASPITNKIGYIKSNEPILTTTDLSDGVLLEISFSYLGDFFDLYPSRIVVGLVTSEKTINDSVIDLGVQTTTNSFLTSTPDNISNGKRLDGHPLRDVLRNFKLIISIKNGVVVLFCSELNYITTVLYTNKNPLFIKLGMLDAISGRNKGTLVYNGITSKIKM